MLSRVPQADARPTIPAEALPPDSLPAMLPGADNPSPDPDAAEELAMLAEQAANI